MNWLFLNQVTVTTALRAVKSSVRELAKIRDHIWFEVEIPKGSAAKQSSVNDCTPHDRIMNQVQRAKDRRIINDQDEHRNHEMTRPIFSHRESVSDERHKDFDDGNQRHCDVQPFRAGNPFAAHDVWPD